MTLTNTLFIAAGVLAILYGVVILWSVSSSGKDVKHADWLESEEITRSKFNNMEHMKHLLRPERQNISFTRSKGRGYAMVAIGIVLIVLAFT